VSYKLTQDTCSHIGLINSRPSRLWSIEQSFVIDMCVLVTQITHER
jgi:hypothetical protein